MKLTFWGVRGSIPVPEINKMKVGGNTSCVEVDLGISTRLILDAGTGIRPLGAKIAKEIAEGKVTEVIILLSHYHWDHIQGFPFFNPIFNPKFKIYIFGPAKANRKLEGLLSGQMEYDYWPVKFSQLPVNIDFYELNEGSHLFKAGLRVIAKRHIHPGTALGYRVEFGGKSFVYCTDAEHFQNQVDKRVVDLSTETNLLIHDAQYTDDEIEFRLGWGHSTWRQSVDVAKQAGVKRLVLFHMDPERCDEDALAIEAEAKKEFPGAVLAKEGMTLEV